MASQTTFPNVLDAQDAVSHATAFGEQVLSSFGSAGRVSLEVLERGADSVASFQEQLADRAQLDWVAEALRTQANLTREMTGAYVSVAGRLLGHAGDAAAPVAETAKATARAGASAAAPATGELPIAGYDELTAGRVADRLASLTQAELAAVAAYEQANQARSTVRGRIDSLTGDEPVPGYDALSAAEARKLVSQGDEQLVARVREYERRHKARATVLKAAG